MSTSAVNSSETVAGASAVSVDQKLEVMLLPVSDVERAKQFYSRLGWRLDADRTLGEQFRLVQFTPPGSGSSIQFGINLTTAAPGSLQGTVLAVADIDAVCQDLAKRGLDLSEVYHCAEGTACRFPGIGTRVDGAQPEHASYSSFASFRDPDGNSWVLQEVTKRLPGRVTGNTTYGSAQELAAAMIRAAKAHGEHEKRIGHVDAEWPVWYVEYMVREQSGDEPPQ